MRQRKGELLGNLGYSNMSNFLVMFLKVRPVSRNLNQAVHVLAKLPQVTQFWLENFPIESGDFL